jgi:formylglycine-generating enzyme required for sulfatase activity
MTAAAAITWGALVRAEDVSTPAFQEKEGTPVVRKHRPFPWLPVLLGVGAGAALIVLLGRKKGPTLTVNLHVGTRGTPAATARYKKGATVAYRYAPAAGFEKLQVRLDGALAPASGTVTMNGDHELDVSATEYYILTINLGAGATGTPAATAGYGRDQVVPYSYSAQDGRGTVLVRLDNVVVPASGTVTMSTDHTLVVSVTDSLPSFSAGVLTYRGMRYEMVLVPAGEFRMGSDSKEAFDDERPVHTVMISRPFWLGRTEVSQELWQAVMGTNPSRFKDGGDYPVEEVSWSKCQDFIQSLNQMLGSDAFRLPTEAEWEYACRAGTGGDRYGELDAIAWYRENSAGRTHPVGLKQPNAFGLFDMLGNVWEWCWDLYSFPYPSGYQVDPTGPNPFFGWNGHVYRGGGWEAETRIVRATQRDRNHPNNHAPTVTVGFRLARSDD